MSDLGLTVTLPAVPWVLGTQGTQGKVPMGHGLCQAPSRPVGFAHASTFPNRYRRLAVSTHSHYRAPAIRIPVSARAGEGAFTVQYVQICMDDPIRTRS